MKDEHKGRVRRLTLSAMLLALGIVLPFFTMQLEEIGNMLLPMHLPVMLCGLICGWKYGGVVGFILPLLRSLLFGRPVMYPNAAAMALELMTYGIVVGLVYTALGRGRLWQVYAALVSAMLAGRAVWGCVYAALLGASGSAFTLSAFLAGAFLNAIPGIVLQLVLIPAIIAILKKSEKERNIV